LELNTKKEQPPNESRGLINNKMKGNNKMENTNSQENNGKGLNSSFEMSSEIKDIAAALAMAQSEFEAATKSESNPFFKSKYADLASITEVYRKPLAKNKIAVLQPVATLNGEVSVTTMLVHASGQYFKSVLSYKLAKTEIQAMGSAITYLRRYSIQSLLSIPAADDDGEAATDRKPIQYAQTKPSNGNGNGKTMGEYSKEINSLQTLEAINAYIATLNESQKSKLEIPLENRKKAIPTQPISTQIIQ